MAQFKQVLHATLDMGGWHCRTDGHCIQHILVHLPKWSIERKLQSASCALHPYRNTTLAQSLPLHLTLL